MRFDGAEYLLFNILTYFRNAHRNFGLYTPQKPFEQQFAFYHNYTKFGLSIVVTLPFTLDDAGKTKMSGAYFDIVLKKTSVRKRANLITLRSTLLSSDYCEHLDKKIAVLQKLILDSKKCKICGRWMHPHVSYRKPPQEKTRFVSFYCQQCNAFTPTTFGIGLKSKLHKYLKKE